MRVVNRQFTQWVEDHYNAQLHSVLGMSPLDRFALDRKWVRFLPPNEANDELFLVEEDRYVRANNTFAFKSLRWEAPRHLPNRTLRVHFQRSRPTGRVVVYYKAERRGEARPLNSIANDHKPGAAVRENQNDAHIRLLHPAFASLKIKIGFSRNDHEAIQNAHIKVIIVL